MINQPEHTLLFAMKRTPHEAELLEAFQKNGYNLLVAETGEETICIFSEHPKIDVLLISIDLPGMDAVETVCKIRQNNTSVPVILLSNFVTIYTIRLALGIGCNEILQTPVSPIALQGIIFKYLNN